MLKIIVLLPRGPGLSHDEFSGHLQRTHLPLVAQLPGLRRLVVNRALPESRDAPPECGAIAEEWFDDAAALRAALTSAQGQAVVADASTFLDMERFQLLIVYEEEIRLVVSVS